MLTASDAEENLLAAIRAGASGYLLKTEPPEQIAAFLRGVARGDAALSGGVARRLLDRVRDGGRLERRPRGDRARALRPRGRGAAPPRRAPRHGRDRPAALHLGAHRALAREEPAARSSASRRAARRSSGSSRRAPPSRRSRTRRARLDEVGQRLEVVAALEHGGVRGASAAQRRASSRKPSAVTAISASGSSACASKPAETSTSSGLERPHRRLDDARRTPSRTPRRPSPAGSGTLTTPSAFAPGPPVPGPERPLVQRDEENASVVAEERLGAVPVVDVEVDDRDPLEPELGLRVPGRDRDVAEDAEAHRRRPRARGGRAAGRARSLRPRPPGSRTRRRAARPPTSSRPRTCPGRATPRRSMRLDRRRRSAGVVHALDLLSRRRLGRARSPGSARAARAAAPGAPGARASSGCRCAMPGG